ncbi:uncharacterized protein [Ptychodera flava]|uniref:uncharacterized protein n=1 Tax=Ptychodera flava TaxID=63121 RepID=UPI003969E0E3
MAKGFDFIEWSKEAELLDKTIEKLTEEDLTTVNALKTLTNEDTSSLGLTMGQRNLLKKAVENLQKQDSRTPTISDNTDGGKSRDDAAMSELDSLSTSGDENQARMIHDDVDSSKRPKTISTRKSVLILNDEWGTSKGGISTVHRQIAKQAKDAGFDVYVTSLDELSKEDRLDAEKKEINVIQAVPKGSEKPELSFINITHKTYFPDLETLENLDVIIGHIPVTADGALDIGKHRLKGKRVFQFAHVIPEDTDVFKEGANPKKTQNKEKRIMELAEQSDAFFSVGPRIYNNYDGKFHCLKNWVHKQYIPYPDDGFFDLEITPPEPNHPVRILTVGRVDGVAHLKGYDIMAEALSKVCEQYAGMSMPLPKWDIRGIPEDKHVESRNFIDGYKRSKYLQYVLHPYGTQKEIMEDLKQSHLFIMPSRSEPFGMVGMEAIAAGLPVLVTRHSGLADFIEKHFDVDAERMIVDVGLNDYARESDIEVWKERIIKTLIQKHFKGRFKKAREMKEELRDLQAIRDTHQDFAGSFMVINSRSLEIINMDTHQNVPMKPWLVPPDIYPLYEWPQKKLR